MGPTFVHKNMRYDEMNDAEKFDPYQDGKGRGYASYNKPYSVMAWLEKTHVAETWVLMMDTDQFLRAPVDPVALGVARGNVVSAEYTYLYGTRSGFASRFLSKHLHGRMAQVGGFHIFHREDLRQIAPKWLDYTRKVRAFANAHPEEYFNESIQHDPKATAADLAVLRKQARWHGEMYGYVFAAAEVGVTHRIRRDVMLYPGLASWLTVPSSLFEDTAPRARLVAPSAQAAPTDSRAPPPHSGAGCGLSSSPRPAQDEVWTPFNHQVRTIPRPAADDHALWRGVHAGQG